MVPGQISPWRREVPSGKLDVEYLSDKLGVVIMQIGTQVVPDVSLGR